MSNISVDNIRPSAGGTYRDLPRGVAAAWVFQDSVSGTPNAGGSENVSSFTDSGVGDLDINFTNAMSAAEAYAGVGSNATFSSAADTFVNCENASFSRILTENTSSTGRDDKFSAAFFGDLA